MLKITCHTETHSTTLQLEGRLAGPWVEELERSWASAVSDRNKRPLRIDLSAVTYVDAGGKDLLKRLYREGAEFVASGCLTSCIVEEITRLVGGAKGRKRPYNS
jgi:anti-anti-sigma regulatory factor